MNQRGRIHVIFILVIATIVLVTSGTLAYYNYSTSTSANLRTAGFLLKVNDSTSETQTLSDMTLAPGDTNTRDIKIDTSGIETSTTLAVTLTVRASGALPAGLSVSLDGVQAAGTDTTRTVTKAVDNTDAQVIHMAVSATWTTTAGENLEPYRNLTISYDVAVVADQKAGS